MVDGLISLQTFDRDGPCDDGSIRSFDFEEARTRLETSKPARMARPDRMHAYAAMAAALVDAGLVHRGAEDADHAPFIDLTALKAITERRDVSPRIGSLIRQYLGSLAEIHASVVPDPERPHAAFEVTRWCLEIGRIQAGVPGVACQ
jgi:hypothetical protein